MAVKPDKWRQALDIAVMALRAIRERGVGQDGLDEDDLDYRFADSALKAIEMLTE